MNKAAIKQKLESFPRLFLATLSLKRIGHWSRHWIVSKASDVTIEGYPRSGNSFSHSAFRSAQTQKQRIATHVHSYAQIVRSVDLSVPTMVLLRNPKDACLSLVALSNEIAERDPSDVELSRAKQSLLENLRSYKTFYEKVLKVKDGIIVAEFNLVTSDFGEIIRRMNKRFGTAFEPYENSEQNDSTLFKKGGFHLSPNQQRDSIKDYLRQCFDSDDVEALVNDTMAVYQQMLQVERQQAEIYGTITND
jgi:predicted enzyme related to lactoylglutathione lyase